MKLSQSPQRHSTLSDSDARQSIDTVESFATVRSIHSDLDGMTSTGTSLSGQSIDNVSYHKYNGSSAISTTSGLARGGTSNRHVSLLSSQLASSPTFPYDDVRSTTKNKSKSTHDDVTKCNDNHCSPISDVTDQMQQLRCRLDHMESKLRENDILPTQLSVLLSQVTAKDMQIQTLSQQMELSVIKLEQLQQTLINIENERNQMKQNCSDYYKRMREQEVYIQEQERVIETQRSQVEEINHSMELLMSEMEVLRIELQDTAHAHSQALEIALADKAILKSKCKQLKASLTESEIHTLTKSPYEMPSRKLIFWEALIELEADAQAMLANMWQHAMTRLHMSKLFAFRYFDRGQRGFLFLLEVMYIILVLMCWIVSKCFTITFYVVPMWLVTQSIKLLFRLFDISLSVAYYFFFSPIYIIFIFLDASCRSIFNIFIENTSDK